MIAAHLREHEERPFTEESMHLATLRSESGVIRVRYWLPLIAAALALAYVGFNVITLISVALGGRGLFDPFFHAPIRWIFGG